MKIINGDIYQKDYQEQNKKNYINQIITNIFLLIMGVTLLFSDFFVKFLSIILTFFILAYAFNELVSIFKSDKKYILPKIIKVLMLGFIFVYLLFHPGTSLALIFTLIGVSIASESVATALLYGYLDISKLILGIVIIVAPLLIIKIFVKIIGFCLTFYSVLRLYTLYKFKKI